MKTKFVRIDSKFSAVNGFSSVWTEWFCLAETWRNPYNDFGEKTAEYREWCAKAGFDVCPDVTVGGGRLNDGWGSDISNRMGCLVSTSEAPAASDCWCDAMDAALLGETKAFALSGDLGNLDVVMTPYETITPDEESILKFGPYADEVRFSLETANGAISKRTCKTQ